MSKKQKNETSAKAPVKLTRAEKKEIQAVIRKYKGDGKPHSAQVSIPYEAMYQDGVCRVTPRTFSKCIEFTDISYQLAQADTKTAIFENLCDLYNYLDASIHVQFSFINRKIDPKQYAKSFEIRAQGDDFDDIRSEYSDILQDQLVNGNNGLMKRKFMTYTIEADSLKMARARLRRIETDLLGYFKSMGASAWGLDAKERLEVMHSIFHPDGESIVSGLWPLLSFAAGLDIAPQFGRVLNSKKVSDHHAIIPTMEFVQKGFDGLTEGEKKLLSLVCCKLLCAVAAPHVYEAVTATFTCAGNTFTAKGKTILTPGWKELDRRFKASFKTDADDTAPEPARELPEISEGQTFDKVTAAVTEHFTAPPKSYTEDTLLSTMERAGAEDMPEDAERQGLGTPATRASILEKLVQMGFVERKGKQLLPTKDGHNLVCVLPDVLTSPQLTAEWETKLTAIAKGEADPEGFMAGIEEMTRGLISRYSQISEDAQKLFQTERVVIGKCPRCGEAVYEGKKNYYCGRMTDFLRNGARRSPRRSPPRCSKTERQR